MTNLADSIELIVKEEISPGIRDSLNGLDPVFREITDSSMGVTREGVGRDYKVKHTFVTSLAGGIRALADTNMEGDTLALGGTSGTSAVTSYAQNTTPGFPGINESPGPGYVQRTLQLKRWRGNLFMPMDLLRADALDASIGSAVALTIKQTAKNIAVRKALKFFDSTALMTLGTLGTVASGGATTVAVVAAIAGMKPRSIYPGMAVNVYASNAASRCDTGVVGIVQAVEYTGLNAGAGNITIAPVGGSWASQVASTDVVVPYGSTNAITASYGPSGPVDWMKTTGTIFGIATANFPQFRSYGQAMGASLTGELMRRLIGPYLVQFDESQMPDTILTTPGAVADYVGEMDGKWQINMTGGSGNVIDNYKTGYKGVTAVVLDGVTLDLRSSAYMTKSAGWVMKLKNNIKRYVPPGLPGAASDGRFGGDVEFIAPLGGLKGIWMHATSSDSVTGMIQAPFEIVEEYAPESVRGILLSTITEWTA
jgi:hypothetical protein